MAKVTITREGRLERNLEAYRSALPGALTAAGFVVVVRIQRIFVLFRPRGWATGHTARSVTVSPPYYDGTYWRVKVGPTTKYAIHLELGRPPGKAPPPDAMLDWVREKHISGIWSSTGPGGGYPRRGRVGSARQKAREDRSAAYLIGQKIAREGTLPFPAVQVGFRQARDAALRAFIQTLSRGIVSGTQ